MNPEKFSITDKEQPSLEKEGDRTESIETFFIRASAEQLELSQNALYQELEQAVAEISENTTHRTEAEGILQKFNDLIGRKTRFLVVALSLMSPVTAYGQEANYYDEKEETVEVIPKYSETTTKSLQTLRQRVWSDDNETQFIFYGREGQEKMIIEMEGEAGANQIWMSNRDQMKMDEKIYTAQQKDLGNSHPHRLIIQHNHPAQLVGEYYHLLSEELEQMESGKTRSLVAPPSMTDLFSYEKIGYSDMEIIGQVQEPSGTWTFKNDKKHPIIEIVSQSRQFKYFQTENINIDDTTTGERQEIYARVRNIVGAEMNRVESMVQAEFDFSYSDTFVSLMNTAESIRSQSVQGEDVSGLIETYIDLAAKLGIVVEYQPL